MTINLKFFSKTLKFTVVMPIFCSLFLSACQTVDVRGHYVSDSLIAEINKGNLTQEQVIEKIGTPSYIPEYTQNTWYYMQRSLTKKAWFDPKVIEQRIVKVTFNQNNIATKAELIENSQKENINIQKEFTPTPGTELNGVQKFVKNMGRFNKTTGGKKKKKK